MNNSGTGFQNDKNAGGGGEALKSMQPCLRRCRKNYWHNQCHHPFLRQLRSVFEYLVYSIFGCDQYFSWLIVGLDFEVA